MEPEEYKVERYTLEDFDEPPTEFPIDIPTQYGGKQELDLATVGAGQNKDHGANMMEFNIKTSTEEAIKLLRERQAENNEAPVVINISKKDHIEPDMTAEQKATISRVEKASNVDAYSVDFDEPKQSSPMNQGKTPVSGFAVDF